MADIQRLNRGGQISIHEKKVNLMHNEQIRSAVAKYSSGSCTASNIVFVSLITVVIM